MEGKQSSSSPWNEEKPGRELQATDAQKVQSSVQTLFDLASARSKKEETKPARPGGDRKYQFMGAQCVSLRRSHLVLFGESRFLVCEKSDGVRYLLYITRSSHSLLINRKNTIFTIRLSYLTPNKSSSSLTMESLFDCELVKERNGDYSLLIFDTLCVRGKTTFHLSYTERLEQALLYTRERFSLPFHLLGT